MGVTLGVIVAGGMGQRLGLGVPKAMAELAGMALLERAVAILAPCVEAIVVAAPPDHPLKLPSGARAPHRIDDATGFRGPLAGVVAALESRPYERAIVLGVDFPLIRPATLDALLARLGPSAAVLPAPGDVPQPLAAAYGPAATSVLGRALRSGEHSITSAARALDALLLGDDELARLPGGLECFLNLNTPGDWALAERLLRVRATLEGAA